jgi:ppGpp synthetase/RelA/SpoT-type nucleotidyltranferase
MAEFERPEYSKTQIVKAGKVLRQNIIEITDDVINAFVIAHNWRSSYAYPMHRVRQELRGKVSREKGIGVTAARLKRMSSIRKKLSPGNRTLYQMQDIAGARAILPNLRAVDRVSGYFEGGDTQHSIVKIDDYISTPKPDGYRSRHIILKYTGTGDDEIYGRQFVEVQLRTEKQHAWATAVEAVGLVRNEDLKGGEGDANWLRFFSLMSAEIAEREVGSAHNNKTRREELTDLDAQINATVELRSYNQALRFTDRIDARRGGLFLINFDPVAKQVTVSPYSRYKDGNAAYDAEERDLRETNAVLVEVDRVLDLKSAYPNYFLNVHNFIRECEISLGGDGVSRLDSLDVSWLRDWRGSSSGRSR